jgi:hypothetical protein
MSTVTAESFSAGGTILFHPDGYVGAAVTFNPADTTAITVGGRKVIRAGTIWPANNATAKGVVYQDVDVTGGAATAALLTTADINLSKIPVAPTAEAVGALPTIKWYPGVKTGVGPNIYAYPAPASGGGV